MLQVDMITYEQLKLFLYWYQKYTKELIWLYF